MAKLEFDDVSKSFGGNQVLNNVSLEINDGELIALLGPSGCGKTTMLRLLAGFEQPSSGTILKDNEPIASPHRHVAPEDRNMGIVFQSYALWPNMTVAQNVAYPLKLRKIDAQELEEKLGRALATVELSAFADASPATLSGGQRQRVALARCLVMQPDAVLLDEPLANLDAHLRDVMQRTFQSFHHRSGATMVYVTHDQAEAMAMADRIAVMFDGKIAQVAKPQDLYHCPANEQVAGFIGQSSLLTAHLERNSGGLARDIVIAGRKFKVRQSEAVSSLTEATAIRLSVRPEHVHLRHETGLSARVKSSVYLGERYRLYMEMSDGSGVIAYSEQPANTNELVRFEISDGWAIGPLSDGT